MSSTVQAHRIETTLTEDGVLTLKHLPFQAGETVEVIVLTNTTIAAERDRYPLRGTTIEYKDPFEPVAADDWEVLQ